jgi:hypothetical protein
MKKRLLSTGKPRRKKTAEKGGAKENARNGHFRVASDNRLSL